MDVMELPKKYQAQEIEAKWRKFWEENQTYKFNPDTDKDIFSVDTPPPTMSGAMHAGHSFSYSQTDFIVRYQRMRGKEVFYPFGTDDNGIPTEKLVEKEKKVKSSKMSRTDFIKLCVDYLEENRPKFIQDWKDLGISCDFEIFYSTINDYSRKISQRSFLDLYKKGKYYRKHGPSIWCPTCETNIAQAEMEDKNIASKFVDLKFELENGEDLIIATTRPEMLPACVAIFIHPEDKRANELIGKKVKVPLFNQEVEIKTDERADPEKGTGVVMCCTFGDQTDIEWYRAHNLDLKIAITKDGRMTDIAGEYTGLKIKEARSKIIEELKIKNLLVNEKDIERPVNVHERCGTEIEILESAQWFLKYLDLRETFLDQGQKLNWYPQFMKHRYDNWIKGLQWDWGISRQRHFGIPLPIWYCDNCENVILPEESSLPVDPLESEPEIKECPKCGCDKFNPEKDVMDTWATSSLTPQLATELFKNHPVFEKLQPTMNLRPQAHDIISFWLFNTVVKSYMHNNTLPWEDVAISGFLQAPDGTKMSKSRGNAMIPQEIMGKYSADALRYFASSSKLGDDLPYQEKEVITGSKTAVKMFNACKFAVMQLEGYDGRKPDTFVDVDKWILSKLQKVIEKSTESLISYEYSKAKREVNDLFWLLFCDNYLEIVKDRTYNKEKYTEDEVLSAHYTLYQVSLAIIKLFAPFMPHITEEVYHFFYDKIEKVNSIHLTSWPEVNINLIDDQAEEAGDLLVDILTSVRRYKSQKQVSLRTPITELRIQCEDKHKKFIPLIERDLMTVSNASKLVYSDNVDLTCDNFAIELGIDLGEVEKKD
jgi:valyl-tRNA synthetase